MNDAQVKKFNQQQALRFNVTFAGKDEGNNKASKVRRFIDAARSWQRGYGSDLTEDQRIRHVMMHCLIGEAQETVNIYDVNFKRFTTLEQLLLYLNETYGQQEYYKQLKKKFENYEVNDQEWDKIIPNLLIIWKKYNNAVNDTKLTQIRKQQLKITRMELFNKAISILNKDILKLFMGNSNNYPHSEPTTITEIHKALQYFKNNKDYLDSFETQMVEKQYFKTGTYNQITMANMEEENPMINKFNYNNRGRGNYNNNNDRNRKQYGRDNLQINNAFKFNPHKNDKEKWQGKWIERACLNCNSHRHETTDCDTDNSIIIEFQKLKTHRKSQQ